MRPPNSLPVTALLTALVALGLISTDLYLPSLPSLARYFAVGVDDIQLTLSVFLVGLATAQLVYGPLSDRFGRRPVLLVGLAIYVVASIVCMLSPSGRSRPISICRRCRAWRATLPSASTTSS